MNVKQKKEDAKELVGTLKEVSYVLVLSDTDWILTENHVKASEHRHILILDTEKTKTNEVGRLKATLIFYAT